MYNGRKSQKKENSKRLTPHKELVKNTLKNSNKKYFEINPTKCLTDNDCESLNRGLDLKSKFKCHYGECIKKTFNNNKNITFNTRNSVLTFDLDTGKQDKTFQFIPFHKDRNEILEFFENVKYLVKYNLIQYYNDNGHNDYLERTLQLKQITEFALKEIVSDKINETITIYLDKFNKELEKLKLKIKNDVNNIIDIIIKSDNKNLNQQLLELSNNKFDKLSWNEKFIFLKKHKELILTQINNNKNKIDGPLIFKINSLLNPKIGGKLKKEKEKLKKVKGGMKKNKNNR